MAKFGIINKDAKGSWTFSSQDETAASDVDLRVLLDRQGTKGWRVVGVGNLGRSASALSDVILEKE